MVQEKEILDFVKTNLLDLDLIAVLQVGSSVRGYSNKSSDIDLMAFYNNGGTRIPFSTSGEISGVSVKFEHDDLEDFLQHTMDHRFNFASLRQLQKVRDGKVILGKPQSVDQLMKLAQISHLDRTVLLHTLARVIHDFDTVKTQNWQCIAHFMIQSIESIASVDLLTTPNSIAYSKPKWLYHVLRNANQQDVIDLLNDFHQPSQERRKLILDSVNEMVNELNIDHFDLKRIKLFKTAANDALNMINNKFEDSFPAVYFLTSLYHFYFFGCYPKEIINSDKKTFAKRYFDTIFFVPENDIAKAISKFMEYVKCKVEALSDYGEYKIRNSHFSSHIVHNYNLEEILPFNSIFKLSEWDSINKSIL